MVVVRALDPPLVAVASTEVVGGATPSTVELDSEVLEVATAVVGGVVVEES